MSVVGRVVFWMWGELSSEWGELSSECGASCLGASCLGARCLWGELSVIQLANLHFHFTSVPRCTPMTD